MGCIPSSSSKPGAVTISDDSILQYYLSRRLAGKPERLDVVAQLSYLGPRFFGWQSQGAPVGTAARLTVQGCVSTALQSICGDSIAVWGASRTDSDVSAKCQLCWFSISTHVAAASDLEPAHLQSEMNSRLDPSIRVLNLRLFRPSQVKLYSAVGPKTYSFYFSLGARGPADSVKHLVKQTVYARSDLLNLRAMCEALSVVVGTHDFRFLSSAARTQSASGAGRSPSPSAVQETSPTHVVGLDDTGAASLLSPLDSTPATAGAGSESEADEDAPVSSGLGRNARNTANQKTVRTISSASLALLSASEVDLTLSPLLSGDGHCLYQYSAPPANSGTPSALEISSGSGGEHNYDGLAAVTPELVEQRPILRLKVTGNGFLMHMVRKIAAATLMVGKGRLTVADLTRLMATADALAQQEQLAGTFGDAASLRASRMMYMHLSQSIVAASGKGLYLEDIALPPTFWTDLDFCNNETPGYAEEYCLPLTAR